MAGVAEIGRVGKQVEGPDWPAIRAVCFDLDGTLYNRLPLRARVVGILVTEWLRGEISIADLKVLRRYRQNRELARNWEPAPDLEQRLLRRTAEQAGISDQRAAELVGRWVYRAPLPALASLRDRRIRGLLQTLRLRGYRIGVFSDYPVADKLEALDLPHTLFDAIVEAPQPEVGALKPNPRGFLLSCEKLGLSPQQVLYVGDRDPLDGAGARAAGMQFALYRRFDFPPSGSPVLTSLLQLEQWLRPRYGTFRA